jgi:hypothetical protein
MAAAAAKTVKVLETDVDIPVITAMSGRNLVILLFRNNAKIEKKGAIQRRHHHQEKLVEMSKPQLLA